MTQRKLIKLFKILFVFFFVVNIQAQEFVRPLSYNHQLTHSTEGLSRNRGFGDTLSLPLMDGFTNNSIYPSSLWLSSTPTDSLVYRNEAIGEIGDSIIYGNVIQKTVDGNDSVNTYLKIGYDVFVNRNYGINAPNIGVLTFDGLDGSGRPHIESRYNKENKTDYADVIRSKPIDLSSYSIDSGLIFSFYYQITGNGDQPNAKDSLLLEFKDSLGNWELVWSKGGADEELLPSTSPTNSFSLIVIDDFIDSTDENTKATAGKYMYDGFQFQFRNIANLEGNNDHWNIDFLRFYKNGELNITSFTDVSIANIPLNILKDSLGTESFGYTSIPASHFDTSYLINIMPLTFHNFLYDAALIDQANNDLSYQLELLNNEVNTDTFLLRPQLEIQTFITEDIGDVVSLIGDTVVAAIELDFDDSLSLRVLYEVKSRGDDFYPENDTVEVDYNFYNYYAYDDGSSEQAYGISTIEEGGLLAYSFDILEKDSLQGIFMHFTQKNIDQSSELFKVMVWDNINKNNVEGEEDVILSTIDHDTYPIYADSLGWVFYPLDEAIEVEGEIYIGWEQTSTDKLNIGLDMNNISKSKLFYNANSYWVNSNINGAVMMRPAIGKKFEFDITEGLKEYDLSYRMFPNPSYDHLIIDIADFNEEVFLEVFNYYGQKVIHQLFRHSYKVNTIDLSNGLYIVRLSTQSGKQSTSSFVVNH